MPEASTRDRNSPRASNMLDRVMRGMNRQVEDGQHPQGSDEASCLSSRDREVLFTILPRDYSLDFGEEV